MTYRRIGFATQAGAAAVVAALACGCTSDDMVAGVEPAVSATSMSGGAVDTGTFPNLNIPPKVAADQISPEQKAARIAELSAAQQRQTTQGSGGVPVEDPALLKKLADTHGDETLKAIQGN
jgi:hypothetical protein